MKNQGLTVSPQKQATASAKTVQKVGEADIYEEGVLDLQQDVEEVIKHQPEIAKLPNDDFKRIFWEQQVMLMCLYMLCVCVECACVYPVYTMARSVQCAHYRFSASGPCT